jgi:drug/metabolite transporter (DMT)-like permease
MRPSDLARLLALAALWGASFLFIRIAAPVMGPVLLIEVRVALAGLTLLGFALVAGKDLQFRRYWRQYAVIGIVNSAIPFVLIAIASLQLPASLAAILNATTPLFGAIFAYAWLREPLTKRKVGGLVLGFLGVAVLAGWAPIALSSRVILAAVCSLLGAASYGLAGVYTKARAAGAPAIGMAVGSQLAASLALLPLVPFTLPSEPPGSVAIISVLALAFFCTALAYLLYFRLVVDVGPLRALTVTFLVPIFATLWGGLFLNEAITLSMILGCSMILVGTGLTLGLNMRLPQRSAGAAAGSHGSTP